MIFTVGLVVVNGDAFVDHRRDTLTPLVRSILNRTAHSPDSFEIVTAAVVPQIKGDISSIVSNLIVSNSVDWILVVGGIGFEDSDQTPEAN